MSKEILKKGHARDKARLQDLYEQKLRSQLKEQLKLDNVMEVPKIEKIVLNTGVKEAVTDSKILNVVIQTLSNIAGQKALRTTARKSIAGFKIREGMPLGARVTLRRKKMYEFLDKLINLALPKVRDFQGVPTKFDRGGNYNLGIKEWVIFPEADTTSEKVFGLNVTICTSAKSNTEGFELLKSFGMPFKRNN